MCVILLHIFKIRKILTLHGRHKLFLKIMILYITYRIKETFWNGTCKINVNMFMRYFGRFILNKFDVILNTSWRL